MLRPHDRALTRRRSDPDVGSDLANCSSDSLQPLAAAPSSSAPAPAVLAIAPGYLSSSDDESLPRAPPSVRWMMEAPLHLAEPETPPWALVAMMRLAGRAQRLPVPAPHPRLHPTDSTHRAAHCIIPGMGYREGRGEGEGGGEWPTSASC